MLKTLIAKLSIVAATLALVAASASAAVVTRTFSINSAVIADLYSGTFDSALTPCNVAPPDPQECAFFNGYPPAARHVVFSNVGTGSGFMTVSYEDTTGEVLQVTRLRIDLPNVNVTIDPASGDHADVTVVQGNSFPVANDFPIIEAGTGTLGRDIDGLFGSAVGQGTPDPDEGVAIGQAAIFQHDDQPNADTPDFAIFADIVDTCVDPTPTPPINDLCQLIPLLNLDGIRYRLLGTVSTAGGNSLVLKQQTANNSILVVNFTTAAEPADYDGDGVSNAADNCPVTPNAGQANSDSDPRGDACDNCTAVANTDAGFVVGTPLLREQLDSDADGYGNRCDPDINNSATVTTGDFSLLRAQLNQAYTSSVNAARSDLNGSGTVTTGDFTILRNQLNVPPGPSGLSCANAQPGPIVPCPSP